MVASRRARPRRGRRRRVSIPFIAGQWSLPILVVVALAGAVFQSPSLRGSGRFSAPRADARRRGAVSIPFIAGQWSLHAVVDDDALEPLVVSIPFIAGQWSLLAEAFDAEADLDGFQSPSLRGSGRFAMGPLP